MDLPTYTNIWRIEKRLYKLYDFRLPAPLPITWIGVFTAITVPYVVFLIAVGLPFNHTLVWLYVLPPGVLTWLCTRPVIESKRLPELVSSQLRYIAEPRTWCRMAPFAEKDEIIVTARVWHLHPPKARPQKAKRSTAKAQSVAPVLQLPAAESPRALVHPVTSRPAAPPPASASQSASPPVVSPSTGPTAPPPPAHVPVPERAPAHRTPKRAKPQPDAEPSWSPWPRKSEPDTAVAGPAAESGPAARRRPAWMISPQPSGAQDASAFEVAHDSDPGSRGLSEPRAPFAPASWPSSDASLLPLLRPIPEPSPFPEAGPFPEPSPFPEAGPFPEPSPFPEAGPFPGASPVPRTGRRSWTGARDQPRTGRHRARDRHGVRRPAPFRTRCTQASLQARGRPRSPARSCEWLRRCDSASGGFAGRVWPPGKHPPRLRCPRRRPSLRRAGCSAFSPVRPLLPHWTSPGRPSRYLPRPRHRHPHPHRGCRPRLPHRPPCPGQPSLCRRRRNPRQSRPLHPQRPPLARGLRCARPRGWHPRGGHPRGGHPRGGHPRGGHPRGGHPRGWHPRSGHS